MISRRNLLIGTSAVAAGAFIGAKILGRNLVYNGDFNVWGKGANAAPTGWSCESWAIVARDTTPANQYMGKHVAALTRAPVAGSANNVHLAFNAHSGIFPKWPSIAQLVGKKLTLKMGVRFLRPAGSPHLQAIATITDSVEEAQSTPHPGDGSRQEIVVSKIIHASASQCVVQMGLVTGDNPTAAEGGTCYIDSVSLMIGDEAILGEACFWTPQTGVLQFSSGANTVPANTATFLGQSQVNGQTDYVSFPTPYPCTLNGQTTRAGAGPGGGENFKYTVDPLASGITSTASGQGSSDGVHQWDVPKGTPIAVKLETSAGAAATFHRVSVPIIETPF